MKNLVVLFRKSLAEEGEYETCLKYLDTYKNRTLVPSNSLVIARYSALPFYQELENDLAETGSVLINSYSQHKYISDFCWYEDLLGKTPRSWIGPKGYSEFLKERPEGSFVLKGKTNSLKFKWLSHMFAKNYNDVHKVYERLYSDSLIGPQEIVIREYVPLATYEVGLNGLPFTDEYRFFFLGDKLISCGYYWSMAEDTDHPVPDDCIKFAMSISKKVRNFANFFVLDIARKKEDGSWILIEVNDGQMSGLSMNSPEIFYKNLKEYGKLWTLWRDSY